MLITLTLDLLTLVSLTREYQTQVEVLEISNAPQTKAMNTISQGSSNLKLHLRYGQQQLTLSLKSLYSRVHFLAELNLMG